jgi:hypothetical protein
VIVRQVSHSQKEVSVIQALDLARENTVLKDEVVRLRRELADLDHTIRAELLPYLTELGGSDRAEREYAWSDDIRVVLESVTHRWSSGEARSGPTARLVLIMPKDRASEYASLTQRVARLPVCEVILDRRTADRRRKPANGLSVERRQRERRSHRLDAAGAVVLFIR